MRKKFVEINLKISDGKTVTPPLQHFYEYLIFLEDHILHKSCEVYKTPNKKEILYKRYDELVGNTYEHEDDPDFDNVVDVNDASDKINNQNIDDLDRLVDFPDASDIFKLNDDSDTENLEVLEEFEDIVVNLLSNTKK